MNTHGAWPQSNGPERRDNEMIDSLLVHQSTTLRDTLLKIDRNAHGIAFVVDEAAVLVGIATDGDIRRALLADIPLDSEISGVMTREFTCLSIEADTSEIFAALSDKIHIIPLVDESRRPVDFATFSRHKRIPVSEPSLTGNEAAYVLDCLHTNWISSKGAYIAKFETAFAEYTGAENAIAVSNGTTALQLALAALGIGPGDEVIVPNLTFAASASTVIHAGATPVLVDVDRGDWNLDISLAEQAVTPRTRAIMPVHLYGMPMDMTAINALARRHGLFVVEDAAEAIGSYHDGRHAGALGDAGCFSFFGNKTITTGEGGMVLFADPEIAARARILRDHGMDPERRYWHQEVGFNFRLTNLQAAIGVAQMEKVDTIMARKHEISALYRKLLQGVDGIELPPLAENGVNSHWAFTIIIDQDVAGISRDELMKKLNLAGIETRPAFCPLDEMPAFRAYAGETALPVSAEISRNGLSLPSSTSLTDEAIKHVVTSLLRSFSTRTLISHFMSDTIEPESLE